jgi:hypothetical protein
MKVLYDNRQIKLPDFLLVGAMRSGTTSLYSYLKNHHEIFLPSLKEPQFFSYLGEAISPHPPEIRSKPWNLEDYVKLFEPARQKQVIGEASTSYLYIYPRTQKNITAIYGDRATKLKIIGVLRNPIDRAWSIYTLKRQGGAWKRDFLTIAKEFEAAGNQYQYYNFLASGLFSQQVKSYLNMFPLTKFFLFEELISEPAHVVRECLRLVEVRDLSLSFGVGKVYNFSGVARNKAVAPIYRFLFERNRLKSSLKGLVPQVIREEIKRRLGSRVIKKEPVPCEVKEYLLPKFENDLRQLADLLQNDRQRRIIEDWLK